MANIASGASKNITGKYGGSFSLSVNFEETKVDYSTYSSTLKFEASLSSNGGNFSGSSSASIKIYWHDNKSNKDTLITSKSFKSLSANATVSVSATKTIAHKDDGTLSGYAKCTYTDNGYGPNSTSISTNNTALTPLSKATMMTSYSETRDEDYYGAVPEFFKIALNIRDENYSHNLTVNLDSGEPIEIFKGEKLVKESTSYLVIFLDSTKWNSSDFKNKFTIPGNNVGSIAARNPSVMKFTLTTLDENGSVIGTSTISCKFSITGFGKAPTFSLEAEKFSQDLTGKPDVFIKGVSTVTAKVAETINSLNSKITKYFFGSASSQESVEKTTNSYTFPNPASEDLFDVSCEDDRGFSSITKFYALGDIGNFVYEKKYSLIDYVTPKITKMTVQRVGSSGNYEPLSTSVKFSVEGTYWNQSFGSKTNSITLEISYKLSTSSQWVPIKPINPTFSGNKFSFSGNIPDPVPTTASIEVEFKVTDEAKKEDKQKTSATVSMYTFALCDGYANVNGMLCNNDELVPSYKKEKDSDINERAELLDFNGNHLKLNLLDDEHPIGSVTIMTTNENPSSIFGGTWELIDKEFASKVVNLKDAFTANTTNTNTSADLSGFIHLSGHSVNLHLSNLTPKVSISDSAIQLGTFNYDKIGVEELFEGSLVFPIFSDAGNAIIMGQLTREGVLQTIDVVPKGTATSMSANNAYFGLEVSVLYEKMLDSFCNKFYFKRTN